MMDSKTIRETALAYLSVYDQDLREEMESQGVIGESDGLYEAVLAYLLDEGYADNIDSAESIIESMSEEWVDDIVEKVLGREPGVKPYKPNPTGAQARAQMKDADKKRAASGTGKSGYGPDEKFRTPEDRIKRPGTDVPPSMPGRYDKPISRYSPIAGQRSRTASAVTRATEGPGEPQSVTMPRIKRLSREIIRKPKTQSESYDVYDLVLSHLIDEGYAETPEAAEVIMVNMSEGWIESIIG